MIPKSIRIRVNCCRKSKIVYVLDYIIERKSDCNMVTKAQESLRKQGFIVFDTQNEEETIEQLYSIYQHVTNHHRILRLNGRKITFAKFNIFFKTSKTMEQKLKQINDLRSDYTKSIEKRIILSFAMNDHQKFVNAVESKSLEPYLQLKTQKKQSVASEKLLNQIYHLFRD
eukprot:993191_1